MNLKEALQSASYVSIQQNDYYYRIDAATPDTMVYGEEDACLYVHDVEHGEDYEYTWDELVELQGEDNIELFRFQSIELTG
jgi:hypothetical protein